MTKTDLDIFWREDAIAHEQNCFNPAAKQVALGIRMSDECVFAELGEQGDPWGHTPRDRRIELNKRYNDKAEQVVGKRLLNENPENFTLPDMHFPYVKRIGEVFEGRYSMGDGTGEWLHGSASTPKELEALLDRVEKLDFREYLYPENWEAEKKRLYETYGLKPHLMRHIRGPVTLAMSIYGEENLIFLYYDEPELFKRFGEVVLSTTLKIAKLADEEAGYTEATRPRGFSFADDNCALLTPDMYEIFGYPVLKGLFETYSPDEKDSRYQHSDSAMAHLLPILGRLNFNGCNFGPTVLVDEIRKYMPNARIDGCIHPITFMNNDIDQLVSEVRRDIAMEKASGVRGLNINTAGSINNGSMLTSMLKVMETIAEYGQY